ncbi:MAG TPA: hypothetical protein VKA21_11735 [Candidatus Binatia bacterium]|nr:hypothetical protein [Candidatus Binatia bacterium]
MDGLGLSLSADAAFGLVVGVGVIVWRKPLVRSLTAWFTRFEGLRLMTEREAKTAEGLMVVLGAALILFGALNLAPLVIVLTDLRRRCR